MDLKAQFDNLDNQKAFLIGVLIAVAYYFVGYNDGIGLDYMYSDTKKKIAEYRVTLAKVEEALENKKRFETEIREITNYMKEFQQYFPVEYSGNELEGKVTAFSEKNNLTILSLKQVPSKDEFKNYPETVVELEIEGEFHRIMQFISDMTTIKKAMDFKQLKFSVSQPSDDPRVKLKTILTVYSNTDSLGAENG